MQTTEQTVETADGSMRLFAAVPVGEPKGAVIVIQEAFGVNDHIKEVTGRFADAGFEAVAPELFHRSGGGTVPYDDFTKVIPFLEKLDDEALLTDVDATLDYLRGKGWADGRIGVVGFCMGGRVSFLVSSRRPIGAGVGFYGGGIVNGRFPQFPALIDEAPALTVPWLGLFGDTDQSIPVEDVEQLRAALDEAEPETAIVRYADAGHGFHCDLRRSYVPEAARDAWQRTIAWFERFLAP